MFFKERGEVGEGTPVEAEVEDQKDEDGYGERQRDPAIPMDGHHNPVEEAEIGGHSSKGAQQKGVSTTFATEAQ